MNALFDAASLSSASRPTPPLAYRWLALVIVSLAMAGNYYVYDSINPLEQILRDQLGFDAIKFGWLNSAYSVAAVLTLLAGGLVIDRLGVRKALGIFSVLCLAGALLTAVGGSFGVMVAGRTVLGLGAESLIVGITAALAKWFKGKELSFAFGVNLTIARLASVAADRSPTWAASAFYPAGSDGAPSWQQPLLIAVAAGALCVVSAALYWLLERHTERRYRLGDAGAVDRLEVRQGLRFDRSYWFVAGLAFTFYSAIFPFRTFAIEFFTNRQLALQGGSAAAEAVRIAAHQNAGDLNSLLPLAAMIATPIFGLLVDRIGRRTLLMTAGTVLLMPVYLMMAYADVPLLVPVAMMGVAFSLIPAVIWPSVAYIVAENRLGTAYALVTLIQQIGFFAFNLIIGHANVLMGAGIDHTGGYALGMWIFSTLGFLGLLFALLLRRAETGPHAHGLETIRAGADAAR